MIFFIYRMSARRHEHVPNTSERSRNPPALKGGPRLDVIRVRSFERKSIGFPTKSLKVTTFLCETQIEARTGRSTK